MIKDGCYKDNNYDCKDIMEKLKNEFGIDSKTEMPESEEANKVAELSSEQIYN